jgi:hypothetical protein
MSLFLRINLDQEPMDLTRIKHILILDPYDEVFWSGILKEYKNDLIDGSFFKIHQDKPNEIDRRTDRINWFYYATVVNGGFQLPKPSRGQCIKILKETYSEPLDLNAACVKCNAKNKIENFKELNLLCSKCYATLHPLDGVFGDKLDDVIYLIREKIYEEHFLERSKDVFLDWSNS